MRLDGDVPTQGRSPTAVVLCPRLLPNLVSVRFIALDVLNYDIGLSLVGLGSGVGIQVKDCTFDHVRVGLCVTETQASRVEVDRNQFMGNVDHLFLVLCDEGEPEVVEGTGVEMKDDGHDDVWAGWTHPDDVFGMYTEEGTKGSASVGGTKGLAATRSSHDRPTDHRPPILVLSVSRTMTTVVDVPTWKTGNWGCWTQNTIVRVVTNGKPAATSAMLTKPRPVPMDQGIDGAMQMQGDEGTAVVWQREMTYVDGEWG